MTRVRLIRVRPRSGAALALAVVALLGLTAVRAAAAPAASGARSASSERDPGWVGSWESAQTVAATSGLSDTGFDDQTVRNIVHTSAGGSEVKIRISNVFGTGPLTVTAAYVGLRSSGAAVEAGTNTEVTFGGSDSVTIAAGDRVLSDPVKLAVGSETDLAVSIYFAGATGPATWHPSATSTSYYASGNAAAGTSPLGTRPDVFSGFGTASESSLTLGAGVSATETVTVQSLSSRTYTLRWAVSTAGPKVTPSRGTVTIPANGTAAIQLPVTAPSAAGSYPVTLNLEDPDGASAGAVPFTVVTDTPGDLAPFYNNTGISDDGAVDQANLDGNGYSYSEQQLTAAGLAPGATVTVGDLQFTWPDAAAGEPDNVAADGQTVVPDVPAGASEIGFLGTGANSGTAGSEGEVAITYTDGTTSTGELGFGGYALGFGGPVLFGNDVVATLPYINYDNGTAKDDDMYVFEATVAVNPDKTVASVTLPATISNGQLHVFALSRPAA